MHHSHPVYSQYSLIFGLGQTGLSCVRFLHAQGLPMRVIDTCLKKSDLVEFQTQYPDIELFLGSPSDQDFDRILNQVDQIIVSPGIYIKEHPILHYAKTRHIPIIGDVELFARACRKPYVAITGSNGKTTVTTLVGELISALGIGVGVGGNIGTPVLDLLSQESSEVYVLELSSFQLETTYSLSPTVATILNITPDHLDRYDSYADYIKAKQKIIEKAANIIPAPSLELPISSSVNTFGIVSLDQEWLAFKDNQDNQDNTAELDSDNKNNPEFLCLLSELKLIGSHNYLNIISALSLAYTLGCSLGLSWESMKQPFITVLKNFKGLDHRCQWVKEHQGVTWINDSKGTNIGASLAALQSMVQKLNAPGKLIWIAGGEGKNQDFELLRKGIEPILGHISEVLLIGKDALLIQEALNSTVSSTCTTTLKQAVSSAFEKAREGDIVLLSPSCSSLDQYANYIARGQDFIQAVHQSTGCQ